MTTIMYSPDNTSAIQSKPASMEAFRQIVLDTIDHELAMLPAGYRNEHISGRKAGLKLARKIVEEVPL